MKPGAPGGEGLQLASSPLFAQRWLPGAPPGSAGKAGKGNGHVPVAEGGSPFFLCLWPGAERPPAEQVPGSPAHASRLSCKLFLSCLLCAVGRSVRGFLCRQRGHSPWKGVGAGDAAGWKGGGAQSTKEKACGCSLTTQACGAAGCHPRLQGSRLGARAVASGWGGHLGVQGQGRPRSEGVLVGPGLGQAGEV